MRIIIFSHEDYTFMFEVWQRFIPEARAAGHEIVGMVLFPEVLQRYRGWARYVQSVKIFGVMTCIKLGLYDCKKRLLILIRGLSRGDTRVTFDRLALKEGLALVRGNNPNEEEVLQWVRAQNADVILLSIGYIIKKPLLQSVKCAVLNKHSSLLPAYKGLLPVFWTMLEGVLPVGITIHKVDEKIDTGEPLVQKVYNERLPSVFAYYQKIYSEMPQLWLKALDIVGGTAKPELIDLNRESSYHSLPSREDYNNFLAKGLRFI